VSVVRTLLAEIGGEAFAFPLAFIVNTLTVPRADIQLLEGRQHFTSDNRQVGLVAAVQVLGGQDAGLNRGEMQVVVVGDHNGRYGVVVDRFLGVRELVVQPLDPRLDGIGLVTLIKQDARLHGLPVMIVSYKDRDEDRRRGMEAGADYYLTKGSFYDETMLRAIEDFIGSPS
jgi:two-component system sensor histidine kinase and response regulator WspE